MTMCDGWKKNSQLLETEIIGRQLSSKEMNWFLIDIY